jgi:hypothetical protein
MTYQLKDPLDNLYDAIRAGFAAKNTTLNKWCKANGLTLEAARQIIHGVRRGAENEEIRKRIMKDALDICVMRCLI